jgi:hypothetical protein
MSCIRVLIPLSVPTVLEENSSRSDSGINTRIQDMKRLGEATDDYYESLNNAMTAQQK